MSSKILHFHLKRLLYLNVQTDSRCLSPFCSECSQTRTFPACSNKIRPDSKFKCSCCSFMGINGSKHGQKSRHRPCSLGGRGILQLPHLEQQDGRSENGPLILNLPTRSEAWIISNHLTSDPCLRRHTSVSASGLVFLIDSLIEYVLSSPTKELFQDRGHTTIKTLVQLVVRRTTEIVQMWES